MSGMGSDGERDDPYWILPTSTKSKQGINMKPYDGKQTTENFGKAAELLKQLQAKKDAAYGGSWQKYGVKSSVFPNVARKFDRLANIITNDVDPGDEPVVDTVADLATYSLLWLTYIMNHEPEKWKKWCEANGLMS